MGKLFTKCKKSNGAYDPKRLKTAIKICKYCEKAKVVNLPSVSKKFQVSVDFVRKLLSGKSYQNMIANYNFNYNDSVFKKSKKLTSEQIVSICNDYNSNVSLSDILSKYKILPSTLSGILNKNYYKDITSNIEILPTYRDNVISNNKCINTAFKLGLPVNECERLISSNSRKIYSDLLKNNNQPEYTFTKYEFSTDDIDPTSDYSKFPLESVFEPAKFSCNTRRSNIKTSNTIDSLYKLDDDKVNEICKLISESRCCRNGLKYSTNLTDISKITGVAYSIVKRIASGATYKHISKNYDFGISESEYKDYISNKILELLKYGFSDKNILNHFKISRNLLDRIKKSFYGICEDSAYVFVSDHEFGLDDIDPDSKYSKFH